jgi:hypothetical protein
MLLFTLFFLQQTLREKDCDSNESKTCSNLWQHRFIRLCSFYPLLFYNTPAFVNFDFVAKVTAARLVELCLFLIKHYAIKAYWRVEVLLHVFLTSALDVVKWSSLSPSRFTPAERAHDFHWTGGWMYFRAEFPVPRTPHNVLLAFSLNINL